MDQAGFSEFSKSISPGWKKWAPPHERAVQLGVSTAWISVAQERDQWRELVERLRLVNANTVSSQGSLAMSQTQVVDSQPPNATWAARLRPRG